MRVLDLGTGSGCLLLALLREYPAACGLGLDRSLAALATARANALRNRLAERSLFAASDWAAAGRGPFDLIVANPPYIRTGDLAKLAPEVRDYEPRAALDGGADGLAAYRVILPEMARLLAVDGLAVVEIGADQEEAVTGLSARAQLAVVAMRRDLGGRPRALVLRRSAAA